MTNHNAPNPATPTQRTPLMTPKETALQHLARADDLATDLYKLCNATTNTMPALNKWIALRSRIDAARQQIRQNLRSQKRAAK